jgi:ABC-type glycerol-3-phosphate transport system substrate-binding protein
MFKRARLVMLTVMLVTLLPTACSQAPTPQAADSATRSAEKVDAATPGPKQSKEGPILITWWSHWANEPAKRAVIETIAADYEAKHPNVDIVVTWWDKNPLRDAVRSTMTANAGAPDITTFDTSQVEWVEAGWLMDLSDVLPWDRFISAAQEDGVYEGMSGTYKLNLGFKVDMLLYNPDIFAELGIEVPSDLRFTQGELVEVTKKCREAGYAGVANAIGNRLYPGRLPFEVALVNLVGIEEFGKYYRGEQAWDSPEARQVLEWMDTLSREGFYPDALATMSIDEYHAYFYTLQEACMLYGPTSYTGRAFKAEAEGGQSPDFRFGMLRYPEMDGAQGRNVLRGGFESGYAVLSSTEHPEVAKDILAFASQPKYGALWVALTNSPTAILYDQVADWPSEELMTELGFESGKWDWYWEEFNEVYGPMEVGVTNEGRCAEFEDASIQALNEGIPQGLLTVDEAIELLNASLCQ